MLDALSESRLANPDGTPIVHPVLAARIRALSVDPEAAAFTIRVTRGVSTVEEQDAIYAEGRTAPGKIVTDAKGTESNHVLGFAVDLVVDTDGNLDWKDQPWIALASKYGLRSGICWHDGPHLELEEVPAKPTEEVQAAYLSAGLPGAWALAPISAPEAT